MTIDPNDPVVLATFQSDVEATLIAEALRDANLDAQVTDGASSTFRVGSPEGVHVLVKQGQLEQAKAELEKIREESAEIDWSKVDIGEPDADA